MFVKFKSDVEYVVQYIVAFGKKLEDVGTHHTINILSK